MTPLKSINIYLYYNVNLPLSPRILHVTTGMASGTS